MSGDALIKSQVSSRGPLYSSHHGLEKISDVIEARVIVSGVEPDAARGLAVEEMIV